MASKEELRIKLLEWITIHNEIQSMQSKIRTAKQAQKKIESYLEKSMEPNLPLGVGGNVVTRHIRKVKKQYSKKYILDKLRHYFGEDTKDSEDSSQSNELLEFLSSGREVQVKSMFSMST